MGQLTMYLLSKDNHAPNASPKDAPMTTMSGLTALMISLQLTTALTYYMLKIDDRVERFNQLDSVFVDI